jgi:hypothetical protein
VWFLFFPREAAGAIRHPAFPTPSIFRADVFTHSPGAIRAAGCTDVFLDVIARSESDEAIHSSFLVARWIASLALAMTVWLFENSDTAVITRESG